ncbi:FKBP-type peptidyl-prolyl cis-trans isomerase N-terminal domain-containing protein, partial [Psychrobacter sp. 1Y4]|uniref:FKBP-type peptidyl-prolyl cis-trans isomerase N-terminal domain-containing protein n=1 Tax=Psychrobacter sp. 1Y4 TaxID=3453575 RepID=UPI003F44A69B
MKKITTLSISALASAMLLMTGCSTNNGSQETAAQSVSITEQSSASEKVGYSLGFMMAEGNKEAVKDLNLDTFEKGFRDGYEGNDSALTKEQMQEVLMTYQKEQEEQFAKDMQTKATENKTAGTAF